MIVSAERLRQRWACKEQITLFVSVFGEGDVEVTEALCVQHADKFDWDWAAHNLFLRENQRSYRDQMAEAYCVEYDLTADLRQKYNEIREALLRGLDRGNHDEQTRIHKELSEHRRQFRALLQPFRTATLIKAAPIFGRLAETVAHT